MRKNILIGIILSSKILGRSQTPESITLDSLRIDSLQKLLPFRQDTARINCLNDLADAFINRDGYKIRRRADSAFYYALMANDEAKKINYKPGLAYALINFCDATYYVVIDNNNQQKDNVVHFTKWEEYLTKLFALSKELNDVVIWASAYYCQANFYGKKKNIKGVIEAYKKSLEYFQKAGNEARVSEISTWLCMQYSGLGEYEKGFDYCKLSLQLAKKRAKQKDHYDLDDYMLQQALMNMSDLYTAAEDYETALEYMRQTQQFYLSHKSSMTWSVESNIGEIFRKMGLYDSALRYESPIDLNVGPPINSFAALKLGETYLAKGDNDSALLMFNRAITGFRKNKNANSIGIKNSLTGAAKAHIAMKNYKAAFPLVKESLAIGESEGNLIAIRDNLEVLSELFYKTSMGDSAYLYLKKSTALKDSILNRQFYFRLNGYKKEAEEEKKTSQINLQQQKLKQQATLRNSLVVVIILLLLLGVFVSRSFYLKRKKQQAESEKRQAELEMQALRAQMNPHFIFNCLSSINRFILKNEPDTASDYLTRFSRLMRMVLMNSKRSLITLEDELEMLTIYLDMERLRFKNNFDYHIMFTNRVDTGAIYVPPLLLQPFCENAIWHGLKHLSDPQSGRNEPGRLDITLSMENDILNCTITDNGIGRKKAAAIRSKSAEEKKSFGLKITTERLALLNQEKDINTSYAITDLEDENGNATGTSVNLKISYKETVEEQA